MYFAVENFHISKVLLSSYKKGLLHFLFVYKVFCWHGVSWTR